jgi:hypothetical protein
MSYDLNNADQQKNGDLISDGTFARVTMIIRPGGIDGDGEFDRGLLRRAKDPNSDVRMIDAELTVVQGPYARRKLWQMFTVQGGKSDENGVSIAGKISQSTFRAMIDSALGLDPQDMSEVAKPKRILRGLADLSGITFVAKIKIEASNDARYGDQNRLDRVVLPNEKEWRTVMDGKDVPASPSPSRGTMAKITAPQPAWSKAEPQTEQQPQPPLVAPVAAWSQSPVDTAPSASKQAGPAWLKGE